MAMEHDSPPGMIRPETAWEHARLAWQLLDVFRRAQRVMYGGSAGFSGAGGPDMGAVLGVSGAAVRQALYRVGGESLPAGAGGVELPAMPELPFLFSAPAYSKGGGRRPVHAGGAAQGLRPGAEGTALARSAGPGRVARWSGRKAVDARLGRGRLTNRAGGRTRFGGFSALSADFPSGPPWGGALSEDVAGGVSAEPAGRGGAAWRGLSGRGQGGVWPGLQGVGAMAALPWGVTSGPGRILQALSGRTGSGGVADTFAFAVLRSVLPGALSAPMAGADGAERAYAPGADTPVGAYAPWGAAQALPDYTPPSLQAAHSYVSGMNSAVQAAMARTTPEPALPEQKRTTVAGREALADTRSERMAFSSLSGVGRHGLSSLKAQARYANMGMR
ncbi:MAG: hypothetical protein ABF593_11245 [Acetobacter papayae]|uniref:hypothetical protein n=2 Tax=Acetobacter papayae TaxID=1076592 RepID=UPI0039E9393A